MSQIHTQQMGRLIAAGSKDKLDELIDICCQLGYIHYNKFLDFNKKNRYIFLKSILK